MNHDVVAETSSSEPHTRQESAEAEYASTAECTTSNLSTITINLASISHDILVYIETAIHRTDFIMTIAQCPVSILDSHSKQHGGNHVEVSTRTCG